MSVHQSSWIFDALIYRSLPAFKVVIDTQIIDPRDLRTPHGFTNHESVSESYDISSTRFGTGFFGFAIEMRSSPTLNTVETDIVLRSESSE